MHNQFITEFLDLKDVLVKKVSKTDTQIKVYIETAPKECCCPACQRNTSTIHDYRMQTIKDCFCHEKQVLFILRKRRYACTCGKRFYESYEFLGRYQRMTTALIHFIIHQLRDVQSMTKVAKLANVSIFTVMRLLNFIQFPKPPLPEVLSIDEFRGNAGGEKFQCILVDAKKKRVIDILPDRKYSALVSYFCQFSRHERSKVKFFVCDMYKPYVAMAKTLFPNATIIIDKYHFVRQVNWALEHVRKEVQKTCLQPFESTINAAVSCCYRPRIS